MDETLIRQACLQLMQTTKLVYVSTVDEFGFPHTRAMSNLKNLELYERLAEFFSQQQNRYIVYLNTNHNSVKMNEISKNPKVCLYYSSFPNTHGLALTGEIEVIEDKEIRKILWQDDWIQFYEGGLFGSDYTILRVIPVRARGWYKTEKYEFIIS